MRIKPSALKLLSGNDFALCWYCQNKTQFALTEKDGSEIWACEYCIGKHGKVKRFKRKLKKVSTKTIKVENRTDLHEKNKEIGVFE